MTSLFQIAHLARNNTKWRKSLFIKMELTLGHSLVSLQTLWHQCVWILKICEFSLNNDDKSEHSSTCSCISRLGVLMGIPITVTQQILSVVFGYETIITVVVLFWPFLYLFLPTGLTATPTCLIIALLILCTKYFWVW